MARAHYVTYALDAEGRPIPGATVEVREPGTASLISETIYANDDPDGTTKTNPFISPADGKIEIWLQNPKIVDLYVTKTGYDPLTIRAAAHQLTSSTLTFKDAGSAMAQRAGVNFEDGFVLADDAVNNETEIDLDYGTTAELVDVTKAAEAAGTSTKVARADHKHDVTTAAAGASAVADTAAEGTATSLARSDHRHSREAFATTAEIADVSRAAEAAGTSATVARGDHKHDAPTAIANTSGPGDLPAEGTATTLARSDHKHGRADGYATTGDLADVSHAAESAGTQPTVARGDHKHAASAATTADIADIAATEAAGTANTIPRGDHRHAHGSGYAGGHTDVAAHGLLTGTEHSGYAFKRKTANETVTSSTAFQNDNDLFFSVGANEVWQVEVVLHISSASDVPDFKWDFDAPGGGDTAVLQVTRLIFAATTSQDVGIEGNIGISGLGAGVIGGIDSPVVIKGLINVGTLSGTVQLRWAQNTSNANGTTVKAGSYLRAIRVA